MVVDTSALMAILLGEPDAERCMAALEGQTEVMISAGTLAEAMIVAGRRNIGGEMNALVEGLGFEIVSVSGLAQRRSQRPTPAGARACMLHPRTLATVSPTLWLESFGTRCCSSAMISPRPASRPPRPGERYPARSAVEIAYRPTPKRHTDARPDDRRMSVQAETGTTSIVGRRRLD